MASEGIRRGREVAVAEDTVEICVIDDASGTSRGRMILKIDGARLAGAAPNVGKKLELIHYDDQPDARRHQESAQWCILEDHAAVVMADYTSSEREATRAVAVKNRSKINFLEQQTGRGRACGQAFALHRPDPGAADA